MVAYKLLRVRKDGTLESLFIKRKDRLVFGEWLPAECIPTKGYAVRKGWHCTAKPVAPHLSMTDRVWAKVEIEDFEEFKRPEAQGGLWYIAQNMKIIKVLEE